MVKLPENAVPVERISIQAHPSMSCAVNHLMRYQWALEQIGYLDKVKTILDIACGTGYGTEFLANYPGATIFGIDKDSDAITEACNSHGNRQIEADGSAVLYMQRDVYEFLASCSYQAYDVVVSFETLEHVDDFDKLLQELLRVTRQMLLISVPHNEPDGSWPFHKTFGITKHTILDKIPGGGFVEVYGQLPQPLSDVHAIDSYPGNLDAYVHLLFAITRKKL